MGNVFEECHTSKRSNIRLKNLQKYALKCEEVTYWCDEMKLISQNDILLNCPCFQIVNNNYTNSKDVPLDISQFEDCIFDSISIILDVFQSCLLYKVMWVYEWISYNLMDFRFFTDDSQKATVNWYSSDLLIHWKAWRLQVVSWWKFNIYTFVNDLISYGCRQRDRFLVWLESYYITRFDFRFDFFHSNDIKHLKYEDVFTLSARKKYDNLVVDHKSKKIYTWWTCWNRKDKYIYTRMYQKQVEALDKNLTELYNDYINYDWKVRRLEFEFLSKFTTARHKISLSDEFIDHTLTKQVFEYVWLSEKHWYFSKPKNKLDIPFEKLSLVKQKRIITQTYNNVVKLHKAWINPYLIVSDAIRENDSLYSDSQVLCTYNEMAVYGSETTNELLEKIGTNHLRLKYIYNKIYKNQLGIDI